MPSSASLSYVTGSHSAKVGVYNVTAQRTSTVPDNASHLTYQFNNGVPNQLTQRATPLYRAERQKLDLGIYVQDKWTVNRLTLSGGLRFDTFQSYFPEQTLEPGPAACRIGTSRSRRPTWRNWKDIVPRLGRSYDLCGNGKTALKVVAQQVRDRPGPAGHLRRHGQPGEPPGQHRHPLVDRRRPRLRARLRPDQRARAGLPRRRAAISAAPCPTPTSADRR